MRIVGGKFAGRVLTSPDQRVRCTAEPVRVAMMELLGDVAGARVVDLFAGSGALGLETMSRGAKSVDFVEFRPSSLHAIKANVVALKIRNYARIFKRDAIPFAEKLGPKSYDIAFADPPYESRILDRVIKHWLATQFSRLLVVEHARKHELPAGGRQHLLEETSITLYKA